MNYKRTLHATNSKN